MQQKEKGAPTLCDSMDGTGEHYAKWNKPCSERQTPYDLKWNLINKTSKQAKYNQSHCNKEQTDSNQRGGGRRITGANREGPSKNIYKGHMDKAKGCRYEGERWGWVGKWGMVGGNGDYCTRATIKKRNLIYYNADETWGHFPKWNKWITGQIMHGSTYEAPK